MYFLRKKYRILMSDFTLKETLITLGVLITGLIITVLSVISNRKNIEEAARKEFEYSCNQIRIKVETRLEEHAQLLRGGVGLFAVSDSVTHEEWHEYFLRIRIEKYLPGIQGLGFSLLLQPDEVEENEKRFREVYKDYKPDYKIYPEGKRDIYTSIIYLEPHNERNKMAMGYDMFSESVRRKAMEVARDSNMAMLTGKVELVQEIDKDKQPGVLMYIPFYKKGMPTETVGQRRVAIRGWVYSPYRMRDLMQGIMSTMAHYGEEPLRLQIYDDTIVSATSLLFDSQEVDSVKIEDPNLGASMETDFRGKKWTLVFSGRRNEMSVFHKEQIVIWLPGLIITALLFTLSIIQIRASIKSRQIDQLNKQLERLNADKDRFIAILSHDLKSPFTAILGFLELLTTGLRKYSLEQIETHLNTINDATKNTFNLLQDLLMWTRAHSGKIPFNPEKISFKDKYDNVISLMMPAAEAKNIKIEYNAPDNIKVLADKDMLKTILRNLVSNAIKFTHKGGTIKISAIREDGNTTISVADNGIGIKTDEIDKIFDISKILPSSGTNGEKGSGLGLLLCKEFVETHGGRIWFTSEYGKGSDFRFTLPG